MWFQLGAGTSHNAAQVAIGGEAVLGTTEAPDEISAGNAEVTKGRFLAAAAASFAAVVAFGAFLATTSGTTVAKRGSDVALLLGALVAAWCCARAARRGGAESRGWRLMFVATLVWATGDAVWTVYGITRDFDYPFPSVADVGFLGWAIPASLGLLSFPRQSERMVSRLRTGLDALVIALGILFVSWATVLGPLYRSESTSLLGRVTGLAYPIVDIAIASLVLVLGMRRPPGARLSWMFLGGGLLSLAVTDSIYVERTVEGVFASGTTLYVGWLMAFLLIGLAALAPAAPDAAGRSTRLGRGQELLPYLPFLVAIPVLAGQRVTLVEDPFLVATGLMLLVAIAIRQAMMVTENLSLRDDLEARVVERTAQLETAERRFRSLVQNSSDVITVIDGQGLVTYQSPSALTVLGRPPESLYATDWFALVHPEDRSALRAYMAELAHGDVAACTNARLSHDDGSWRDTEIEAHDQLDEPSVAGVVLNIRDVTERRRAEELRAQLAAIVESSDEAILSKSLDGVVLSWNRAAETLYGYTSAEVVGRHVSILVPPDRRGEIDDILAKASRGDPIDHLETFRVRKDGTTVPVSLTVSAVHDAAGDVVAVSTFARDITARKQAEAALAAARDQALAASRAKSEFLATMSHEIRTPMNGVIGLTGLLLDTELTETQRHHAEGVRASGEALLGIINDILDFSKIEAGKLELETVDFDLAHAVEEVAGLVSEPARAKSLELVAYCHPEVPTALRGDVGRLRQILLNFATNAVKFTEAGEVVVRASLAEEPTPEQVVVRVEVTDTGVGIDAATAGRLFDLGGADPLGEEAPPAQLGGLDPIGEGVDPRQDEDRDGGSQPSAAATWAARPMMSNGLAITAATGSSSSGGRPSGPTAAVSMMTGMPAVVLEARRPLSVAGPSISGIITSRRMASGASAPARAIPSSPEPAVTTSQLPTMVRLADATDRI